MAGVDVSGQKAEIEKTLGIGDGRRRGRRWIWAALVLLLGAGGAAYLLTGGTETKAPVYDTAEARRGDLKVTISATGTVEPTNLVDVSSELSGMLDTVLVDFNDPVTAGQRLARLDTRKLEAQMAVYQANLKAAEAKLARERATLNEAKVNYQNTLTLDQRGIAAHQTLLADEAAFFRAQAGVQVAEADVELAQANVDLQQAELDKACICSPINGIVLRREADAGQIVAASLSAPVLFTIAEDLRKMELQVDVDEADIGRLKPGDSAIFTVDAYDEMLFPAEISKIRYASEQVDGVVTYMATLSLDNSDMLLRPGMTATAEITVAEVKDALLVPNAALRFVPPQGDAGAERSAGGSGGLLGMVLPRRPRSDAAPRSDGRSVWVLRGGTAVEVPVQTGDSDGNDTEILSGDLSEGDRVITDQAG